VSTVAAGPAINGERRHPLWGGADDRSAGALVKDDRRRGRGRVQGHQRPASSDEAGASTIPGAATRA